MTDIQNLPKDMFHDAWVIRHSGRINKAVIYSANSEEVRVYTYDNECKKVYHTFKYKDSKWISFDDMLVFDLSSQETKDIIAERLNKYSTNIHSDYRLAFENYLKRMELFRDILDSNAAIEKEAILKQHNLNN
jgi:hypothetical protein